MKRLALIAIGAVALLLSACAPTFDLTSQVPVQILSITTPAAKGGTVVVQGRNFGDGRTGGADANYGLFARTSDTTHGQRLTVNAWAPQRIEFWSGRPSRLHDRLVYHDDGEGGWRVERLYP